MWEVAFTEHILNINLAFIYIKNIPDSLSVTYVYDIYIYIVSYIYTQTHIHTVGNYPCFKVHIVHKDTHR